MQKFKLAHTFILSTKPPVEYYFAIFISMSRDLLVFWISLLIIGENGLCSLTCAKC